MARKYWLPHGMPEQFMMIRNFREKIGKYAAQLGLSPDDLAEALALCDAYLQAYALSEQCRATMIAMTKWRDEVIFGDLSTAPASAPPVFPVAAPGTHPRGVLKGFMKLRERIVASPGYMKSIGEDLGIIGPEIGRTSLSSVTPKLKAEVSSDYRVTLTGGMQGMDALRVEYSSDGANFETVAFLTTTPGGFQVRPSVPGKPEKGFIRARYIRKNEEVGEFSPNYSVVLA